VRSLDPNLCFHLIGGELASELHLPERPGQIGRPHRDVEGMSPPSIEETMIELLLSRPGAGRSGAATALTLFTLNVPMAMLLMPKALTPGPP
jgi:hypothetical protein